MKSNCRVLLVKSYCKVFLVSRILSFKRFESLSPGANVKESLLCPGEQWIKTLLL